MVKQLFILRCPTCAGALNSVGLCASCGKSHSNPEGILSFAGTSESSALDALDYDAMYRVDDAASESLYQKCRSFLKDKLPVKVETFMEIGAGTGLFSSAFLAHTTFREALITDISSKMLGLCRRRLEARDDIAHDRVIFATWAGEVDMLRPHSLDFVAGFSVLHHVLDYTGLLARLHPAMRPGSTALFLEPNLNFHAALNNFMAEVAGNIESDAFEWDIEDRLKLLCWVGENHINLKYAGDGFVLRTREDKHLFDPVKLREQALSSGFDDVEFVPFGEEGEILRTIHVYMQQLELSAVAHADIMKRVARMLPGAFASLAGEDSAPSSLILFYKGMTRKPEATEPATVEHIRLPVDPNPLFRYQLTFEANASGEIIVDGWVLGDVDIRYLTIRHREHEIRFAVGGVRYDVAHAINAGRLYPQLRAIFCGVYSPFPQVLPISSSDSPALWDVIAEGMDGTQYFLGQLPFDHTGQKVSFEAHQVPPARMIGQGIPA